MKPISMFELLLAHDDKIKELVPPEFIRDIAVCFERGLKDGRVSNGWKLLKWNPDLENLYNAKLMGHHSKAMRATDPEERKAHLAAVAANACILWFYADGGHNET